MNVSLHGDAQRASAECDDASWLEVSTAKRCINVLRLGGVKTLSLGHGTGEKKESLRVLRWLEHQIAFKVNLKAIPEEVLIPSENATVMRKMLTEIEKKVYAFKAQRKRERNT